MGARVHHIKAGTMCPYGGRLLSGGLPGLPEGGPLVQARTEGRMVCHCLLVETEGGLVLVDTGMGTEDLRERSRLGAPFWTVVRPVPDESETALSRVKALGFDAKDVRTIVVTHLDLDHSGGIPDFPEANVVVYEPEHFAATTLPTLHERGRYRPVHWQHLGGVDRPRFHVVKEEGEAWFGFECVRQLPGLPPEILLVPVTGHSRGHAAVAVETDAGWLLHAGDAYFYRGEMDPERRRCTPLLDLFQRVVAFDDTTRRRNQERLRVLARDHAAEVRVFSAHDPLELDAFTGGAAST